MHPHQDKMEIKLGPTVVWTFPEGPSSETSNADGQGTHVRPRLLGESLQDTWLVLSGSSLVRTAPLPVSSDAGSA